MISASRYYVKLLEVKSSENKVLLDFSKTYVKLGLKLARLKREELEIVPFTDDTTLTGVTYLLRTASKATKFQFYGVLTHIWITECMS